MAYDDLLPALIEAAGGQVFAERIVGQLVDQRLAQAGVTLTPEMVAQEERIITQSLSSDADQAQRLLRELRLNRGWGEVRFAQLLRRNAGLRRLVQDQVKISDPALKQAFELRYGPRYEIRLITVDNFTQASEVIHKARAGESFIDLAIHQSTDASKAQGGLLSPINLGDESYPDAIRAVLPRLTVGEVSDPIALDKGFAVLRLERKIEAEAVKFDDVKESLIQAVRLREEQMLMQRMTRQLLIQTDVTVMDPAVEGAWQRQKQRMLAPRE